MKNYNLENLWDATYNLRSAIERYRKEMLYAGGDPTIATQEIAAACRMTIPEVEEEMKSLIAKNPSGLVYLKPVKPFQRESIFRKIKFTFKKQPK